MTAMLLATPLGDPGPAAAGVGWRTASREVRVLTALASHHKCVCVCVCVLSAHAKPCSSLDPLNPEDVFSTNSSVGMLPFVTK